MAKTMVVLQRLWCDAFKINLSYSIFSGFSTYDAENLFSDAESVDDYQSVI